MSVGENDPSAEVAIAFENVVKSFGERKVLDDISFRVGGGEALCILGRSGTGKSVTLRLMIGLIQPDSGEVVVQGKNIPSLGPDDLAAVRRNMGFLFQNAALFDSFSLNDNLALPLHRLNREMSQGEIRDAVQHALHQVGLEKDGGKMPVALSGGMRKRAGLARALVLKPKILLIDEPSSGLDRITSSEIDELLIKVKTEQQTTMVIVTHDIRGARRIGDKFAVLSEGRLLAFGSPDELDKTDDPLLQQFISET